MICQSCGLHIRGEPALCICRDCCALITSITSGTLDAPVNSPTSCTEVATNSSLQMMETAATHILQMPIKRMDAAYDTALRADREATP